MFNLLVIALALSMDSFSVSVALAGNVSKNRFLSTAASIAAIFGLFHIMMITLGFLLGQTFESTVSGVDHWIAVILLTVVGVNMLQKGIAGKKRVIGGKRIDMGMILSLSLATSIDALVLGMGIAFLSISIPTVILTIGLVVFALSLIGFFIGLKGESLLHHKAGIAGGVVLILIGIKILLEHLFF